MIILAYLRLPLTAIRLWLEADDAKYSFKEKLHILWVLF